MNTTRDGTSINQRDLLLVPFPYTDLTQSKKRPALVVSKDEFNRRSDDVICCLVTSNPNERQSIVPITNKDMESGFLEFDSRIKPYRLFTVSKGVVYKNLGRLKREKFNEVVSGIYDVIPKV